MQTYTSSEVLFSCALSGRTLYQELVLTDSVSKGEEGTGKYVLD